MDCCWFKLLIEVLIIATEVFSIPLDQFFPFGPSDGDHNLILEDDDSSPPITASQPFTVFGRQRDSLYVNSNGVISLLGAFYHYTPQHFPYTTENETILCPFWDDIDPSRGGNIYHTGMENNQIAIFKATQLIQTKLGYTFYPTTIFTATWDHVLPFGGSSEVRNTFQCALASGKHDTFLFFLYADNLMEWTLYNAQVGVDGGDGVNYYSIPNSLTPEIINITHTSNVNTPGLWILKVDNNIVADVPSIPRDLIVKEIGATEAILSWEHNESNSAAENFIINCTGIFKLETDINIEVADQTLIAFEYLSVSINNTFIYSITELEEYTNYTCTITARNAFGQGPISESIVFTTNSDVPSGPPNHIMSGSVSVSTFHLKWSPPPEKDRNGIITGYRILLDWDMGQELRATTTHTNYTFTGLQQDTDYYYRIAAETSAGLGPFSNRTLIHRPMHSEKGGLNLGLICGAGGAGVLLLMLTIATLLVLCLCKRKKKYNTNSMSDVYEATDHKSQLEATTAILPNYKVSPSAVHRFNNYDNPPVACAANAYKTQPQQAFGVKKKPLMPKHLTSLSKQECSSDGLYMPLNPARMETSQNQDQQYMTISAASRNQTSEELKKEEDVVYEEIDKKETVAKRSTTISNHAKQQDFNYYVNTTKTV